MVEHETGVISLFLQYVWVPLMGVLAYLIKKRDAEIDDMKSSILKISEVLNDHKLFAAENYIRKPEVIRLENSIQRMEDKLDAVLKLMIKRD